MMPRSTPATRPATGSAPGGYPATGISAVTSTHSRPMSYTKVTDRTSPGVRQVAVQADP